MILKVDVTKDMVERARARDLSAGNAFRGASIEGGKGRFYGYLGEEIVHATMPQLVREETKDYDLRAGPFTFDVKTKTRKDEPRPWFDATVDKSAMHQANDYYVFVSILAPQSLYKESIDFIRTYEYKTAWILGYIHKQDFLAKARYFNSGDVDPSNGLRYRENIYLVKVEELSDPRVMMAALSKAYGA